MPRKKNPEAARIEANYKSKKRSIDSQVKSASNSAPATKKAGSAAKSKAQANPSRKSPFAKLMKDGGSGKLAKSRKKKRKAPTYRG